MGILVIVRKEISDTVSNKAFLLTMAVLMISIALTGATAGRTYFLTLPYSQARAWARGEAVSPTVGLIIINELIPQIRVLGALVAVCYGFNAINKERTEGSLKVLLSYPIYRDQIILGKLLAGFLVISLITIASMVVALALYLYATNLVFSLDLNLRFAAFTLISILFLSGYLGLSMLFSIAFKDQKITLLSMFLILGLFNSYAFHSFSRSLTHTLVGREFIYRPDTGTSLVSEALKFRFFIYTFSPTISFERLSDYLQHDFVVAYIENEAVRVPSNLWGVLWHFRYSVLLLAVIPILTFAASYALFTRRDIS